ncbi:NUDIX hydrolase [Acinetobacter sp. NIPH 1958]|uniref:NUDIX hydrolase n=1 Tax=unclassified Acinetobacter TaxID=196816 RepID=UPI000518CC92|nr:MULTISPECIES: NUDIX hydrolase N-terminal domain-containing protein [unclassified Acinetobacter]MCH7352414.1 NUDIX hydrolase [Acinetobacter sp. NIPH 2023]MCH7355899.1 NUDIX hydrolase [Acinetobacter sp. NIPH 1958]MCH7359807.1 NUDIX hydrolase [Acinetobacter sp. NIPH 2024]
MKDSAEWIETLNKITGLAQSGLYYSKDVYDRERYEQLLDHVRTLIELKEIDTSNFIPNVLQDIGYATPKIDVRAVVFKDNKLLLAKETQDGLWSIPGGWADVGYSAAENAEKEVLEETGLEVKAIQLLALTDRRKHPHPAMFLHVYKAFFWCEIIGGDLKPSIETSEVGFFGKNELPPISTARVTEAQIHHFFELRHRLPENTYFD